MFPRRGTSDSAVGWISTVDSLLLGFGLMVVLALHSAMAQQDLQVAAKADKKELGEAKNDLKALQTQMLQEQKQVDGMNDLLAESNAKVKSLTDDLKGMSVKQDELNEHARRLQEQLDAEALGNEGVSQQLGNAILERDLLRKKQVDADRALAAERAEREDAVRRLSDADSTAKRLLEENKSLQAAISDIRNQMQNAEDREEDGQLARDALTRELASLKARITEASHEVEMLKQTVWSKDRAIETLQADAAELERMKNGLAQEMRRQASEEGQAAASDVLGFSGAFRHVVFLIDVSGSMVSSGGTRKSGSDKGTSNTRRWDQTKREIVSWARHLPMESLRVVFFWDKIRESPGDGKSYVMSDGDRDKSVRELESLLSSVSPKGLTNTPAAFAAAYSYPGVDTIVLFTDGNPNMTGSDTPALIDKVHQLVGQHPDIPVNVVGIGEYFSDKMFAEFLLRVAGDTGGQFIGR